MQGYFGNFVGGGGIKSIQTFSDNITAGNTTKSVTISSVDVGSAIVFATQDLRNTVVTYTNYACRWNLTGSTTLTLRRTGTSGSSDTVSGFILEFEDGIVTSSNDYTTSLAAAATSATKTITSVDSSNSIIVPYGATQSSGIFSSARPFPYQAEVGFNSDTEIQTTVTNPQTSIDIVYGYQVIEF